MHTCSSDVKPKAIFFGRPQIRFLHTCSNDFNPKATFGVDPKNLVAALPKALIGARRAPEALFDESSSDAFDEDGQTQSIHILRVDCVGPPSSNAFDHPSSKR